ncbi:MAG: hypothetical protein IT353_21935 [Gemmatimonadaceae bacterium]|nr:hypothetical protein [Gemmatimonadaceae bacterium]
MTAQTTVGGAAMGFLFGALASSLGVALTGGTDFSSRRWTIITVSTGAAAGFLYGAQRRECRGFLPPVSPRPARMAHHPQLSVP